MLPTLNKRGWHKPREVACLLVSRKFRLTQCKKKDQLHSETEIMMSHDPLQPHEENVTTEATLRNYTLTELEGHDDSELLLLLKKEWGYLNDEKFEVIGQLSAIQGARNNFFVLENIRSLNTGESLTYPLERPGLRQTIFVGPPNGLRNGQWARVAVELSPKGERERHHNPFGLNAVAGSACLLQSIPKDYKPDVFQTDDGPAIDSWLLDVCQQKHQEQITEEGNALRSKILTEHQKLTEEGNALRSKMLAEHQQQQGELLAKAESLKSEIEQQLAGISEAEKKDKNLTETINTKRKKLKEIKSQMDETHTRHTGSV